MAAGVTREAFDRAALLYRQGQLAEALAATQRLLLLAPDMTALHNLAGAIHMSRGDMEAALTHWRRSTELSPGFAPAHNNLGLTFHALRRNGEAVSSLERAIALQADYAEAYNNLGSALTAIDRFAEAERALGHALRLNNRFADAHNNRGALMKRMGRPEEAVVSYRTAIALAPAQPGYHYNLGLILIEMGQSEAARTALAEAVRLKPDYVDAQISLGVARRSLGDVSGAEQAFAAALTAKPDHAWARFRLAETLSMRGANEAAFEHYLAAAALDRGNREFWTRLAGDLSNMVFSRFDARVADACVHLLRDHTLARPRDLFRVVLSLIRTHDRFAAVMLRFAQGEIEGRLAETYADLAATPLLFDLLARTAAPDQDLERLLTALRRAMLLRRGDTPGEAATAVLAALALHCFHNEYVFVETPDETAAVEELIGVIEADLKNGRSPSASTLALLGAYRPLSAFAWSRHIEPSPQLDAVFRRQLFEVDEERALRSSIPMLAQIDDPVSSAVRQQYEENPYPRWVNTMLAPAPCTLQQMVVARGLDVDPALCAPIATPDVLIAGCGTGQQAVVTASTYRDACILAIDLSLASLAYAKRMAGAFRMDNLEFLHADILTMAELPRRFDLIESVGVLHHLADPLQGWRVLRGLLKPHGLMFVGLYSDAARQGVKNAQAVIAQRGLTSSLDDIRSFREAVLSGALIFEGRDEVLHSPDFYSASECRDLLFHVQEQRFTIADIEAALAELNLRFLGFEFPSADVYRRFSASHGDRERVNLTAWRAFEEQHPSTFAGMYQFWVCAG